MARPGCIRTHPNPYKTRHRKPYTLLLLMEGLAPGIEVNVCFNLLKLFGIPLSKQISLPSLITRSGA